MAIPVSLLGSAARTSSVTTRVQSVREKYEALHLVVDVTAGTAFNLDVSINGYDPVSTASYTLLAGTINGTGTTVLKVGPQYTAATNVAKDYMPADWRVVFTISGGVGATFSAAGSLI